MLVRERLHRFVNRVSRSANGLWTPDGVQPLNNNISLVLGKPEGKVLMLAHNIVTNAGDEYYAEAAAGESVTNNFNSLYLSTTNWDTGNPAKTSTSDDLATVISGSEKTAATGYPQSDDQDADNTGAKVDAVTWKFSYAKGDFNDSDIDAGAISVASATFGGTAGDLLLTAFDLTAFSKTSNDTLTVYVNHEFSGV